MAERPFSGALPEWADTPWTVSFTGPPPLRPTTKRLSMKPVSKLKAAAAPLASSIITALALENMCMFSSSPAKMHLMGRPLKPAAARALMAKTAMVRPPFMSSTPGPWAKPFSSMRKGFSLAAPSLNTVSTWPMKSRGALGLPLFHSATSTPPAFSMGTTWTLAPTASSSRRMMLCMAATPSSWREPLSVLTISSQRASMSS